MNGTHTPAPWKVERGRGQHYGRLVITADHAGMTAATPLAHVSDVLNDAAPDARLIAAAPDLLAALQKFVGYHVSRNVGDHHLERHAIPEALAAIRKATTGDGA